MKVNLKSQRLNLILLLVLLCIFIIVSSAGIDKSIFLGINSFKFQSDSFIWSNLTFLGDTLPVCAIMILFLRKMPDLVWSGIISTIIATLIVNVLKHYLDVPRPLSVIDKDLINIIGPALYAHSFPSGHTVTIFTFAGLLIYRYRSVFFRIAIIILAILVGISRIAVGAHWPTDVISGAAIGILCSMTGVFIVTMPGWKSNRNGQVILGGLLILTNMYLLLIYNCGYGQAIYFQRFFALTVLVAGSREYYLLLRGSGS
jgi:membrane-associated phospholipid phosphatase